MPASISVIALDRRRGALAVSGLIAAVAIAAAIGSGGELGSGGGDYTGLITVYGVAAYSAVGVLILWQRPRHGIGRLTLAIGLAFAVTVLLDGLVSAIGPLPLAAPGHFDGPNAFRDAVMMLVEGVPGLAIWFGGVLLIAWFPDGRPSSPAGILATCLVVVTGLLILAVAIVDPIVRAVGLDPGGAVGDGGAIAAVSGGLGIATLVVAFAIAVVDLGMRYRRTDPVRRAQIRWVIAAAGLAAMTTALVIASGLFFALDIPGLWDVWILSLMLPVLAIGIAVTRYHLYDIDRIVSSTIAYSVVSLVLVTVFGAVILGLQTVLVTLTNGETIAVAASTLLAASLFQPVRGRVQTAVDRRFHRARYDADRTVATFAGRLRGRVDLASVRRELELAAVEAVEPATSETWLRTGGIR